MSEQLNIVEIHVHLMRYGVDVALARYGFEAVRAVVTKYRLFVPAHMLVSAEERRVQQENEERQGRLRREEADAATAAAAKYWAIRRKADVAAEKYWRDVEAQWNKARAEQEELRAKAIQEEQKRQIELAQLQREKVAQHARWCAYYEQNRQGRYHRGRYIPATPATSVSREIKRLQRERQQLLKERQQAQQQERQLEEQTFVGHRRSVWAKLDAESRTTECITKHVPQETFDVTIDGSLSEHIEELAHDLVEDREPCSTPRFKVRVDIDSDEDWRVTQMLRAVE